MSVETLNTMNAKTASHSFRQCCTSQAWIENMVASRPYDSAQAVIEAADKNWLGLQEQDYLEAFDGHPKIGDVGSLKAKYSNTKELAAGEQSLVEVATDDVIQALSDGNTAYQEKFGFIFIVCATGKSAAQMLSLLNARLPNSRELELTNAAEEQRRIFQIRLEKLL
ncbi:MAG: 2-oxo-4-hydroxy-4-carboxy-5-ureidoimidazoline decarboxylase [Halioglobus sp.]|jgi:2-oxo-4-hydroxy-4-carboxy-5-ureidoimidazoline decarboxylase